MNSGGHKYWNYINFDFGATFCFILIRAYILLHLLGTLFGSGYMEHKFLSDVCLPPFP